MQIESKKKKLCLEPLRGIITQGEKMADTVIFRLPATYGALILSDLSWQIRAASEKNTLVTADLTASSGGEFCLVQWEVSANFTAVSGALSLMLVGTDSEGNVVIKFPGDDPIWIRDSETGEYAPPPDALEQAVIGIQQAQAALESAQESLEDAAQALQNTTANFRILGHYDSLPELQSAITNPSVGDAYGVGDPTVVYVWNGTSWAPLPGVFQPYPHTNLLVNPRFKYNSRDQQSYSSSSGDFFSLDGWVAQSTGDGTVSVSANSGGGITLTTSASNQGIKQLVYKNKMPNGTYTISILVNGTVCSETFAFSGSDVVNSYTGQNFSYVVVSASNDSYVVFPLIQYNTTQQSYTITAVKLERGSVSTLQAELDNPPPEDVEKLKLDMYDLDPGRCAYLPWHNENLLDNWYFVGGGSQQGGGQFPINQRGETSWNTGGYHLDRWKQESDGFGELGEEGFTPAVTGIVATTQPVEEPVFKRLLGKKVTISALLSSGEFRSRTIQFPADISQGFEELVAFSNGGKIGIASYPVNKVYQLARIYIPSDSNKLTFVAIKVELGYLSTLARKDEEGNWVLNDPPPNFQQELAKCQRYYRNLQSSSKGYIILNGIISASSSGLCLAVPFGSFRTTPTVAINGTIILRNGSGYVEGNAGLSGLSASVSTNSEAGALCLIVRKADGSAFDAPNNTVISAMLAKNCQISFSADL